MKSIFKLLASALAYLLVYPLALSHRLYYWLTKSEKFFHAQSQVLSLVPGMIGSYLRRAYYQQTLQACSSDCEIHFGALITHVGAEIGPGVIISHFAEIGLATLEAGVLIGSHTMIVTAKRTHLAEVEGSILFDSGVILEVREHLNFLFSAFIYKYGYLVKKGADIFYWYDSQPHPNDPELQSTPPHHKHIPPDIKHHRIPAPGLSFEEPNLTFLIREIESQFFVNK